MIEQRRADTPNNQHWLPECQALLNRMLSTKIAKGQYGSIGLEIMVKDGVIQGVETFDKSSYRQKVS